MVVEGEEDAENVIDVYKDEIVIDRCEWKWI